LTTCKKLKLSVIYQSSEK